MKKRFIIIIFSILVFIFVDQLVKIFMVNKNITVIPNVLSFNYTKNYGIAFGTNYKISVILIASIFLIFTLIYIMYKN